jgi:hypothetical protein
MVKYVRAEANKHHTLHMGPRAQIDFWHNTLFWFYFNAVVWMPWFVKQLLKFSRPTVSKGNPPTVRLGLITFAENRKLDMAAGLAFFTDAYSPCWHRI